MAGQFSNRMVEYATLPPVGTSEENGSKVIPESFSTAQPKCGLKIRSFIAGLATSATGIGIILSTALGALHLRGFTAEVSILLLSFLLVFSVLLIGFGFGLMVLSSGNFDQQEFDRLIQVGNISSAEMVQASLTQQMQSEVSHPQQFQENVLASAPVAATGYRRKT